ncbi:hypothetical protein MHLNE_23440 [Moorella humiferrea]|uniref:lactate utilization protein n=1 Tax=Neomoorella humiferrea TaxID=676965 RepID=UPI0030D17307
MTLSKNFVQSIIWHHEQIGARVTEALKKRGFQASFCKTALEAREQVLNLIPDGASVGIGGSVTIRHLGLVEELKRRGHEIYDHWIPGISPEEDLVIRRRQLTCDVFLTGCNAITLDGRLINTDFTGNRVAAMIFGPKKTIMVAGINKIVRDIEAGLRRIKDVATPMNSYRRHWGKACAVAGHCVECNLPDKSCRVTTIIEMCPKGNPNFQIVLIGKNLGY